MTGTPAISVRALRVVRGDNEVLTDVSVEIERGSVTGLLGPSGTGKTTLIRAIVGVQIVADGEVHVLGEPAGAAGLRSRVGYVTQAPSVYSDLSVRENLDYFARIAGSDPSRVEKAISDVHLSDAADRVVRNLSGGQRARVSLGSALLGNPDLLVLDEPTVGLDPVLRAELWELFESLAAGGTTLLVSSHVMDEAVHCDRLLLMRDGGIFASATPDELLERTGAEDMEQAFLKLIQERGG